MKVIYILRSMAELAGTERIMSNKMNYLSECGYDVTLITYEQGNHPQAFILNKNISIYDFNTRFFKLYDYGTIKKVLELYRLRKLFKNKLEKLVQDNNPNIICCTTYSHEIIDMIASIAKKYHVHIIIESHVAMKSLLGEYDVTNNSIKHYIKKLITKIRLCKIKDFDKLVVLTNGDAKVWSKYKVPVIIPNIIFKNVSVISTNNTKYRIICAGRLEKQKGYDLLVKAFTHIHKMNWTLNIFGDGPEKERLTQQIIENGLDGVIRINNPSKEIIEEYCKSDFLVLSSRYEGFGLVLAEAMACGIPCVAFDCPYGPSDIIRDKEDGLLVENGNVAKLAEAISWMIEHPEERLKMGERAKHNIERFYPENIMPQWDKLFKEIVYGKH